MPVIKDLIAAGDLNAVFVPLLPLFPQAMRYVTGDLLDRTWPEIKVLLESRGVNTSKDRATIIKELMVEDPVELASEIDDDPFRTLIRTILSARSKDEQTIKVSNELFKKYDTVEKLANAPVDDVEYIIKPIGFYKNKTKNIIESARIVLNDHGGKVPDTFDALMELPGVGMKVANCVLVYAYGIPAIPVDTHVQRIVNRWGLVETTDPNKTTKLLEAILPRDWWLLVNDLLIRFGKEICKPITPRCPECPLNDICPKIIIVKEKTKKKPSR
ncbi:MAG TPA: endonuclease III [Candidatus Lokiarchaeia archaeon]|nr:endonuclease III [Candidatus Lokiarchaeia archaeon]